ncbi:MAG: UDP-N-acetylenolpyruvoylglucosamine reductase, partial [bacterium]|nr:UDP-N-acetylenolpyruvoylglucosamine reductase [bacterium]
IKKTKLPAATLIEAVGLKGHQQGHIKIADYHGNLIMNLGGGRSRDVLAIAELAKKMVYKSFGVRLEEEVRILDN